MTKTEKKVAASKSKGTCHKEGGREGGEKREGGRERGRELISYWILTSWGGGWGGGRLYTDMDFYLKGLLSVPNHHHVLSRLSCARVDTRTRTLAYLQASALHGYKCIRGDCLFQTISYTRVQIHTKGPYAAHQLRTSTISYRRCCVLCNYLL